MVRSRVALYFADRPPARAAYVLTLGSQTIDIPAGEREYWVRDSYRLPVDVELLSVYPHAHYLGKEMRAFAELPDGSVEWLLHIRGWDFNWQDVYRYAEPLFLPRGTTLVMEFSYDNSADNPRNPHRPPQRVVYGPQTTDEMGNLFVRVLNRDSADRRRLDRDFAREYLVEQIEGYRFRLGANPDDPTIHNELANALRTLGRMGEAMTHYRHALEIRPDYAQAHYNLGTAFQALGSLDSAVAHYRAALRLEPDEASTHYNLGGVLQAQGQLDSAVRYYRRAVALEPEHANAHNNLGNALLALGRLEDAMRHYRLAIAAEPEHADAHNNLGNALTSLGRLDAALEHYRLAVRAAPGHALARHNLGLALTAAGRVGEAVPQFREAARLQPEWSAPAATLAWILATHPDEDVRRPDEAVTLAQRAAALTERRQPAVLDALAAAYAAAGRFGNAVETAEQAVALASQAGDAALARAIEARLERYRRRAPYRAPGR